MIRLYVSFLLNKIFHLKQVTCLKYCNFFVLSNCITQWLQTFGLNHAAPEANFVAWPLIPKTFRKCQSQEEPNFDNSFRNAS